MQPGLHLSDVDIVPEPRPRRQARRPRLLRIDFPGMEVEDCALALLPIEAAQLPARQAVGQQAKIAAAAARQDPPANGDRRDRTLQEARARSRTIRKARPARYA